MTCLAFRSRIAFTVSIQRRLSWSFAPTIVS